jgi:predicted MPP superfamily phosphohydrolase
MAFPHLLFGAASSAVAFGAHRVLLAWAERSSPAIAAKRRPLLVACAVISVTPWVSRQITTRTHSPIASAVLGLSMFELMIVLSCALPLLLLMFISSRTRRRLPAPVPVALSSTPDPSPPVSRRSAIETIGGAAFLGASSIAFGWGMTIGRHDYEVCEVPVRIPGLPKELDGYVIGQISDIHTGLFVGERELGEAAEIMRKLKPDLVVATGDLVDMDSGHAPRLARTLADFPTRDGVFAILGNHDYYAGFEAVSAAVRAAGVTLLVNESRVIQGGFGLIGIDDAWSESYGGQGPDLSRGIASLPPEMPRILLAHQPNAFYRRVAGKVALQLSGHTHGGQIRPGNRLLWGPVAGRYERLGSTLYVNRGFGVAGPPARLGVRPEVTKIILVAA